jgi:hypothetical protein
MNQIFEISFQRLEGLHGERAPRDGFEIAALSVLIHFLARPLDRVLLIVEKVLYERNELDLAPLIDPISRAILRGTKEAELAFPISQHVRLETGQITHLTDRKEFLDWL